MTAEKQQSLCSACAGSADPAAPDQPSFAKGCGHFTHSPLGTSACYCDFCATDRDVCARCGGSMGNRSSRPSHNDERMLMRAIVVRLAWVFLLLTILSLGFITFVFRSL